MSRFSRKEAEAAGWRFVHERDQYETVESSTQGRVNITPATIVAEKYVSLPGQTATLVHEEAETEGKLLERIAAYEAHLRGLPSANPAPVDESDEPREIALGEGGDFTVTDTPAGSVIVPADPDDPEAGVVRITDAAWTAANRTDSLVLATEDGTESVTYGGAREDVATAVDAVDAVRKLAEDQRSSEPHPGPTVTLREDGDLAVVREGEEDIAEASDRADEERKLVEEIRVNAAPIDHIVTAPEGTDLVAGADAGLARRTDLESEQPGQGQVAGSEADSAETAPVVPATVEEVQAGRDAAEDKAKELRDSADSAEEADDANAQQDVEDAGAEATQEAHDDAADEEPDTTDEDQENPREAENGATEATPAAAPADAASSEPESQSTPSDEPDATASAQALAKEKGVDLSVVTGTGKDGRITQPDVQKALDEQE